MVPKAVIILGFLLITSFYCEVFAEVECSEENPCTIEGSHCNLDEGKCECDNTHVPSPNLPFECLLKATEVNGPCKIEAQCIKLDPAYTICKDGLCQCNSEGVENIDRNKCLEADVRIGGSCVENQQCVSSQEGTSVCQTSQVNRTCACIDGHVARPDLGKCLKIINNLDTENCEHLVQCQNGRPGALSICSEKDNSGNKVCKCNADSVNAHDKHECHRIASQVGEACVINEQCLRKIGEYSHCRGSRCECIGENVESTDKTKCLPKLLLGQECQDLNQCNHIEFAVCADNDVGPGKQCACDQGYAYDYPNNNQKCYELKKQLGETCENQVQCSGIPNSECEEGTCKCKENFVGNTAGTKCLSPTSSLNGTCEDRKQCLAEHSDCVDLDPETNTGKCKCIKEQFAESWTTPGKCLQIRTEINLNCSEHVQCVAGIGELSECRDAKCQCKVGYGYWNRNCYIPSRLRQVCDKVEQCYVGVNNLTMCTPTNPNEPEIKRCSCLLGSVEFAGKCYDSNKRIGDSCDSNEECTTAILGEVMCESSTKKCTCKIGYSSDLDGKFCNGSSSLLSNINTLILSLSLIFSVALKML